jgi:hypothetical protein
VDEKHLREHSVFNVCGVVITSNHKADGIYLPTDDRRHYVAWSDLTKEEFTTAYWDDLYRWYEQGGTEHVAAYLSARDLSGFNCKAPPPKTTAFWEIVEASHSPEDSELADALDELGNPTVVRIQQIVLLSPNSRFSQWLEDRRNSRLIPHRFEECGYTRVRNKTAKDGQWKVNGKRQAIYGRADIPFRDRYHAAAATAYHR